MNVLLISIVIWSANCSSGSITPRSSACGTTITSLIHSCPPRTRPRPNATWPWLSPGAPTLRLLTDRGCAIIWGRAPGDESAGEVPAERKVSYLDYHHEQYGHIDRGFSRELDIRGDVVIGR